EAEFPQAPDLLLLTPLTRGSCGMAEIGRRDFLKIMGLGGTGAAVTGCSDPVRYLVPYIIPPEDVVPGQSVWYASTCRECPAGCGLLAKNRDGRIIKVEGNPAHPVSQGKLCPRGQASLHGLYNPDRFRVPLKREPDGTLAPVTWEVGERLLAERLAETVSKGGEGRVVILSNLVTGTLLELMQLWSREVGGGRLLRYEPIAYEPLRAANREVFGRDAVPSYRIDRADFIVSFGADFLETWISNLELARQFAEFHRIREAGRNPFVYVGPKRSATAANADLWLPVAPGDEQWVALGIIRALLDEQSATGTSAQARQPLQAAVRELPLSLIQERTGVPQEAIREVARGFARAERPLALADGLPFSGPHATATAAAANLLCAVRPGTRATIDFGRPLALGQIARAADMKALADRARSGEVDVLVVHRANPVYGLPPAFEWSACLQKIPLIVSLSSAADETTACAHLILPSHSPLEAWGDYEPRKGVLGLMQPTMGNLFQTRHAGDVLIATGKKLKGEGPFPWPDFYGMLRSRWQGIGRKAAPELSSEIFWEKAVERGGFWDSGEGAHPELTVRRPQASLFQVPDAAEPGRDLFHFSARPTIQLYDGRMANHLWMQELPDPVTQITWGAWVEIHPEDAERAGIRKGDLLGLESPYGSLEVQAIPLWTVPRGTLAMPIGQGHTGLGRFAAGVPGNALALFPAEIDPGSGALGRASLRVRIRSVGRNLPVAHTDGSYLQHGRGMARTLSLDEYRSALSREPPEIDMPLPEGFDPKEDFYLPHQHKEYRWCMVADLDRCIGCGACVVACYAENNVAVVGREQVIRQREMSWLRIQRYFEEEGHEIRWLPMLCQHCDYAPCEAVCPVFAPHHNSEGLNNQVYNRCFGTRFCLQNDPWKVRRFNWFTFTRDYPLDWQLNPDVTVRQKGIMEKCSFCIQRIVQAKRDAKEKGRKVRDGDFTTACAQTCPTETLVFGNLLDPESRVSRLIRDHRRYQVLGYLNTKPAVIYLKKVRTGLGVRA
ncbi:MAG: molybdopterin dinucleotide binding domain-containing protein, partial [bacterium]